MATIKKLQQPTARTRQDMVDRIRYVLKLMFSKKINYLEITIKHDDREEHYVHIDGVYSCRPPGL